MGCPQGSHVAAYLTEPEEYVRRVDGYFQAAQRRLRDGGLGS